jgi:hypothetical protein
VKLIRLKMSPEDKEYLRALYAGMAMNGILSSSDGDFGSEAVAISAVRLADALMEQLEPKEEGIVKARKKRV